MTKKSEKKKLIKTNKQTIRKTFGEDRETHSRLVIKVPPPELIELRKELTLHQDIYNYSIQGNSFEECMARIAEKLDILLDGLYDGDKLCGVLLEALRNRRFHGNQPHLRAKGLVNVELIETKNAVTLEVVKEGTIAAPVPTVDTHISDLQKAINFVDPLKKNPDEFTGISEQSNLEKQNSSADLQSPAEECLPSLSESAGSEETSNSDTTDLPQKH